MAHHQHSTNGQSNDRQRPFSFQMPAENPQAEFAHASGQQSAHNPTNHTYQSSGEGWSGYPEQRFSYLDTPIDDNTQTFDDERQAEILEEARRRYGDGQAGATQPQQEIQGQRQGLPTGPSQYPPEKQEVTRMPSAYQLAPPPEPHPAHAVQHTQQGPPTNMPPPPQTQVPVQQQARSSPPPLSPGPLPIKDEGDLRKPARASIPPSQTHSTLTNFAPPPSHAGAGPFSPYSGSGPDLHTQHRPGQIAHPSMKHSKASSGPALPGSHGHFRYGLCACPGSDIGTCMTGLFCPCILYSRLTYRLGQRSRKQDPTDVLGFHTCNGHCFAFAALCTCGISGVLAAIARGRVRHAYDVDGDAASDCIEGCCCCCCAIIQSEREVRTREGEKTRWAAPSTTIDLDPYKRHESMRFSRATDV